MSLSIPTPRRSALALALLCSISGLAQAADPPADAAEAAPADAKQLDAVSVVARGATRQVQRVNQQDIERLPAGSSALKAIDKLPGVQFQSADATGAYEWSTAIYLHGFDQSRLGFTLDGVPLGNMSYGVTNGLSITRAILSENIASVELAQGAGALGTASNSNLGGTLQFYSADPETEFGGRFSQTVGDRNARRTYARLDTGEHNGLSAYVAYADSDMDKWKGDGSQRYEQFNAKALYAWGEGNRVSLFVDKSRRKEQDYMDLSLTSQKVLGWDYDYLCRTGPPPRRWRAPTSAPAPMPAWPTATRPRWPACRPTTTGWTPPTTGAPACATTPWSRWPAASSSVPPSRWT